MTVSASVRRLFCDPAQVEEISRWAHGGEVLRLLRPDALDILRQTRDQYDNPGQAYRTNILREGATRLNDLDGVSGVTLGVDGDALTITDAAGEYYAAIQPGTERPVEKLYGYVVTGEHTEHSFDAFAIRDGLVLNGGDTARVHRSPGQQTTVTPDP
jgi:hypothetical protein